MQEPMSSRIQTINVADHLWESNNYPKNIPIATTPQNLKDGESLMCPARGTSSRQGVEEFCRGALFWSGIFVEEFLSLADLLQ